MTDRTIIGRRIAELRKSKGLTQAELADLIGVSHQAVSQWERSETLPDILILPALAEIFNESVSAVMGLDELSSVEFTADENKIETDIENSKISDTDANEDVDISVVFSEPHDTSNDNGDCNIGNFPGTGGMTVTNDAINFKKDSYEIVIVKNGKIVKNFQSNPDNFVTVLVTGNVYSLRSEMSVTVEGDVGSDCSSGFGMSVGGNVGGNVKSGFDTKCGDVAGDVNAGFGVHCRDIGGKASGGFGVKPSGVTVDVKVDGEEIAQKVQNSLKNMKFEWKNRDEDKHEGEKSSVFRVSHASSIRSSAKIPLSNNGQTIDIDGDYTGDISGVETVIVHGSVYGSVQCDGEISIGGDVTSSVTAGTSVDIKGDVDGDVTAGSDMKVSGDVDGSVTVGGEMEVYGDVDGDVNAGSNVTVKGDVDGDVSCGASITIDGEVGGSIEAGGSVTAYGEVGGDINCGGCITVEGDVDGNIEAGGLVTVNGDVSGDITSGNDITIDGDMDGDINNTINVTIGGDMTGDIHADSVTVEGDYND